jgi:hypothetical protein
MSTTLEQRQAVGTEAEPKVIREPGRGPIWPFVVAAVALMGVVVAGVTFSIGEETVPFQSDQAVIEGSSAAVREQGPYATPPQVEVRVGDMMTESREGGAYGIVAPTGTLQGLGIDQRAGQAYLEAQEQLAGSNAPNGTLQGLGSDPQIGQAYLDAAEQAGSQPPNRTDWWNQGGGDGELTAEDLHTEAREG